MLNKSKFDKNSGVNFLLSRETQGIKLGLSRTEQLLSLCNNPEESLPSIQIIGTNGKGSTAAFLCHMLMSNGLKVGLYTSPHLIQLNERIQINRRCIDNDYINSFVSLYKEHIIDLSCTFFETLTALSLCYFNDNKVDIAILETGLGGRYDSVTASSPRLQLFTSISKDHMHILGQSIKEIASEKAHAIKKNTPCISVPQEKDVEKVLNDFALQQSTTIQYTTVANNNLYQSPLIGDHQKDNILLAMEAAKKLYKVNDKIINRGIQSTFWPGRIQIIKKNPFVIFDVSHNEQSINKFCQTIKEYKFSGKKTLFISLQKTKKLEEATLKLINFFDRIICVQLNERMYNTSTLVEIFEDSINLDKTDNPYNAIKNLIQESENNDLIAIIGSHYWGEHIEKIFKISLVDTQYKL